MWRNLVLDPLDSEDTRLLLQSLLRLEGGVAHQLQERAAGNPLMAVQLLGQLVEHGSLIPGRRGFAMQADAMPRLPDTLTGVWRARLPELGPVDTAALERAAAFGWCLGEQLFDLIDAPVSGEDGEEAALGGFAGRAVRPALGGVLERRRGGSEALLFLFEDLVVELIGPDHIVGHAQEIEGLEVDIDRLEPRPRRGGSFRIAAAT